jgi:phage replication O-like protein O
MSGGYTKTPNQIYDTLAAMTESELRVTLALVRHTYGYHRHACKVTFSQLQQETGLSRQGVANGLTAVKERGFFAQGDGRSEWQTVKLVDRNSQPSRPNEQTEQSTKLTETVNLVDQNSQLSRPTTSGLKKTIKKNLKKDTTATEKTPDASPVHELAGYFTQVSGLFPNRGAYDEEWEMPLVVILKGASNNTQDAMAKIDEAIRIAKERGYRLASPRSIVNIVANLNQSVSKNGAVKVRAI